MKSKIQNSKSQWHGVDRNKIDWKPTVNESKCIGCGLCVTTCGRGVYKYDYKNKKTKVVNPYHCVVACQTCANLCPAKAIIFAENDATREKAQKIVRKTKILGKVKIELEERKDELKL